ncbi:hypothetical protein BCR34DRAFT_613061 [Clohesyomyces aquaticus]|uniref:Uncharacterized protein n=1 Tax=Clohesyomyces aquaticus TaxID=1231657 RepID=A0A1Y1ZUJ5_9PLEO|nr:hypothetical protein BCR34DRAFT_613061 [Clohesyomyces aquaticus]
MSSARAPCCSAGAAAALAARLAHLPRPAGACCFCGLCPRCCRCGVSPPAEFRPDPRHQSVADWVHYVDRLDGNIALLRTALRRMKE